MKSFLRYVTVLAFTLYGMVIVFGQIARLCTTLIATPWLAVVCMLVSSMTLTSFTMAGAYTLFHRLRSTQPRRGAWQYTLAIYLNILVLWTIGRVLVSVFYAATERFESWRDAYFSAVRWLGLTNVSNFETAENAVVLFTLALFCLLASPLAWTITKRFRISAL